MFKKKMPARALQSVQALSVRPSSSSSSHALFPRTPDQSAHQFLVPQHSQVPMQELHRQHIKDPAEHSRNTAHDNQFLGHDTLPPPVDYSMVKPTTRYQFRALSRRAISFQMRQGSTNCCCLIAWPVSLVIACLVFALIGNSDAGQNSKGNDGDSGSIGWEGLARFCTKEADPQTSTFFRINDLPHPNPGEGVLNVGWYPTSFTVATDVDARNGALPCVRWFGENYPRGGGVDVYTNVSAADAAQPDR